MTIRVIPVTLEPSGVYRNIPGSYALSVSFSKNVKRLRKAIDGLTQDDLGAMIGVGQGAVSKWENGKSEPSVQDLPRIARALGVTVDRLLQGVDAQYDAGRDLLGQTSEVQKAFPPRQGEPDVPATAREIERLRKERDYYKGQVEKFRRAAGEFAALAAGRQDRASRKRRTKLR